MRHVMLGLDGISVLHHVVVLVLHFPFSIFCKPLSLHIAGFCSFRQDGGFPVPFNFHAVAVGDGEANMRLQFSTLSAVCWSLCL